MSIEEYDAPEGEPFRYRRRPSCNAVAWMGMAIWCQGKPCVCNSTWFCFERREDADAFVREWRDKCVELEQEPLAPHTRWDVIGL